MQLLNELAQACTRTSSHQRFALPPHDRIQSALSAPRLESPVDATAFVDHARQSIGKRCQGTEQQKHLDAGTLTAPAVFKPLIIARGLRMVKGKRNLHAAYAACIRGKQFNEPLPLWFIENAEGKRGRIFRRPALLQTDSALPQCPGKSKHFQYTPTSGSGDITNIAFWHPGGGGGASWMGGSMDNFAPGAATAVDMKLPAVSMASAAMISIFFI